MIKTWKDRIADWATCTGKEASAAIDAELDELRHALASAHQPKSYSVYIRSEDGTMVEHHVIQRYVDNHTVSLAIAEPTK